MAKVDELHVAVWAASSLPESVALSRFKMPPEAHGTLAQWAREKLGRDDMPVTTILRGLSEILAWFVPEVAFMRHDREGFDDPPRLCLYFLGEAAIPDVRRRIQAAFAMWLGILYADKNADVRTRISAAATADSNWKRLDVATGLAEHQGVCGVPKDRMLWDTLSTLAVGALVGQRITFRSGDGRLLVSRAVQSDPFAGIELVSFPPKQSPARPGLWSEVVTISTASFPERPGIYLLARPRIRNWGSVTRYSGANDPHRSLDVFIPRADGGGGAGYRHSSIDFRARQDPNGTPNAKGRKPVVGVWRHDESHRLFELLRRFTGKNLPEDASIAAPVIDQDGLWALPRLGTIHGDKALAGGTGLPWPDRQDITESIDKILSGVGFVRVEPMKRMPPPRVPLDRPFEGGDDDLKRKLSARRKAISLALSALGNGGAELDFFVFQKKDGTPQVVVDCLKELLGLPDSGLDMTLRWDGLTIRVRPSQADILAEQLPWIELTESEKQGRSEKAQREMIRIRREEDNQTVERLMASQIKTARGAGTSVACAILEMPSRVKDIAWLDPFAMARRELARQNILPQVVLVDDNDAEEKYAAAVRDCFRMLGVVPVEDIHDLDYAPAAITVIQRNDTVIGGGRISGHAFPLAARVNKGILECAIPEESGDPRWLPYGNAALRILAGEYGRFARNRKEENQAKFHNFFAAVLEQINRCGPSLVIAEMETISHRMTALQNQYLGFDRLQIGNRTFLPSDLPGLRLARTSPDPAKQPHYYHETDTSWPSGIFTWGDAKRTAYALKTKPVSVSSRSHFAARVSRHLAEGDNKANDSAMRVTAQLDEFCLAFLQHGDGPDRLFALIHKLRRAHAQYAETTTLPYPLHELRLLGGSVTK